MRSRLAVTAALFLLFAVQLVCSLFFVWDIIAGVVGLRREPLSWQTRELMEIGRGRSGWCSGVGARRGAARRAPCGATAAMESQLRQVSGAFAELLEERFAQLGG